MAKQQNDNDNDNNTPDDVFGSSNAGPEQSTPYHVLHPEDAGHSTEELPVETDPDGNPAGESNVGQWERTDADGSSHIVESNDDDNDTNDGDTSEEE